MNFKDIMKIIDLFLRWYVVGGGKEILRKFAAATSTDVDDNLLNKINSFIDGK